MAGSALVVHATPQVVSSARTDLQLASKRSGGAGEPRHRADAWLTAGAAPRDSGAMDTSDLNLLLSLDALLQEGNVTRAAKRLGRSTPATSRALERIRRRLGDPLLVRAGRGLVLTPRAEQLKPEVSQLVADARRVLAAAVPFAPERLERAFTVHTTDYVLVLLGPAVDAILRREAPQVTLRFLPSVAEDWVPLRDGAADLSICLFGHFPDEFLTRPLFRDRFVCAVRADHPRVGETLSLDAWLKLDHLVVAPLGRPSFVDVLLAERGLRRRIRRTVPYFLAGLALTAASDDVLTVSARAAAAVAPTYGLRLVAPPLPFTDYALNLLWHPRVDNDPAHRWLRDVFARAAASVVADDGGRRRTPRSSRRPG
jgi:DNA-binding transcriptional LysR family regulator